MNTNLLTIPLIALALGCGRPEKRDDTAVFQQSIPSTNDTFNVHAVESSWFQLDKVLISNCRITKIGTFTIGLYSYSYDGWDFDCTTGGPDWTMEHLINLSQLKNGDQKP